MGCKTDSIHRIKKVFQIRAENQSTFYYVGIHFKQNADISITVSQCSYIESLNLIFLTKEQLSNIHQKLNGNESQLLSAIGQLNSI